MKIRPQNIDSQMFFEFGDILDTSNLADQVINQGLCERYNDKATLSFDDGRAGVSLFQARVQHFPYTLRMMERHPRGSQCFIPMSWTGFLVVVAPDDDGRPGQPVAFITQPGQAINFHKNIWHGVLTPLSDPGLFAVIDRIGAGTNLEEYWFPNPYVIEPMA